MRKSISIPYADNGFNNVINMCKGIFNSDINIHDKKLRLDFIMDTVKNDLSAEKLTNLFYQSRNLNEKSFSIPLNVYDDQGNLICINTDDQKIVNPATLCDVSLLYPHIHSDGLYWYNTHTSEKYGNTSDFRVALMFEISRLINSL